MGPIIEKMLLSGEALWRSVPLGFAALNILNVDSGKTIIITGITIEPFINDWDFTENFPFGDNTQSVVTTQQSLEGAAARSKFSLNVFNSKVNSNFGVNLDFGYLSGLIETSPGSLNNTKNPFFGSRPRHFKTFIVSDEPVSFFFSYPNWLDDGYEFDTALVQNIFVPVNFANPGTAFMPNGAIIQVRAVVTPVNVNANYLPLSVAMSNNAGYTNLIDRVFYPQYNVGTTQNSTILPPQGVSGPIPVKPEQIASMPIINIEYVEINRRWGVNGIFDKMN